MPDTPDEFNDPEMSNPDELPDGLAEAAASFLAGADGRIMPEDLASLARHIVWPRPPRLIYGQVNGDLLWSCMAESLSVLGQDQAFAEEIKRLAESELVGAAMSWAFYCISLGYVIRRDEDQGILRLPGP